MSRWVKILAGGFFVLILGAFLAVKLRIPPPLPDTPIALRALIEKSDLIVYGRVEDWKAHSSRLASVTNRWAEKIINLMGKPQAPFVTAHLEVAQTLKGGSVDTALVDYPSDMMRSVTTKNTQSDKVVAFLFRSGGVYYPLTLSYGMKVVDPKQSKALLRFVSEFVEAEKLGHAEREHFKTEWMVRLMEYPPLRWHGAASWIDDRAKPGEALQKMTPELSKRIEAVAFRDEPLGDGDELLLRELAPARPQQVARRLLRYFEVAVRSDNQNKLAQPWHCHGAMQLLIQVGGMPAAFKERFEAAPYPDVSWPESRARFVNLYLPEIEARLRETGLYP
jgi:hypothetical protein